VIWIISLGSVFIFSTINDRNVIYPCLFTLNFSGGVGNIVFQHALACVIERKIALASDVYSKPPIIIRSHDLHIGNIKGVVNEIISRHKKY
jgi:hypothetical protein